MIKKPRTYLENAILSRRWSTRTTTTPRRATCTRSCTPIRVLWTKSIGPSFSEEAANYVEVTQLQDKSINIENQYNFGVQTPGRAWPVWSWTRSRSC